MKILHLLTPPAASMNYYKQVEAGVRTRVLGKLAHARRGGG
jgi:hypothetical protein